MKQIKIAKELGELIVSGEKRYEFRKLSKGLTSGTYKFVSAEGVTTEETDEESCDHCMGYCTYKTGTKTFTPKEVFGTATLTFKKEIQAVAFGIADGKTRTWVYENYIKKYIDFVAYEVSDVKEKSC